MTGISNGNGNIANQEQYISSKKLEQWILDFVNSDKASEIFGVPYDKQPLFLQLWLQVFARGYSEVSVQVRWAFLNLKKIEDYVYWYSNDYKPPLSQSVMNRLRNSLGEFLVNVSLISFLFTKLTKSLTVDFKRNLEEYIKGSSGYDETVLDIKKNGPVHQKLPEYYGKLLKELEVVFDSKKGQYYSPFFQIDRNNSDNYHLWLLRYSDRVQIRILLELCEQFFAYVDGDEVACLQKYGIPLWTIKIAMVLFDTTKMSRNYQVDFSELMLVSARKSEKEVREFFKKFLNTHSDFAAN